MRITWSALSSVYVFLLCTIALTGPGSLARAQEPRSERADLRAARGQTNPEARITALAGFLSSYPHSSFRAAVQQQLLVVLLEAFPDRSQAIHAAAVAQLSSAVAGIDRWLQEARLAALLADAGQHGADLGDAEHWALDAAQSMTELAYRRDLAIMRRRYRLPALSEPQLRKQYAGDRAVVLCALADVQLRRKLPTQAAPLLAKALALESLSPQANRLKAELLLLQGAPEEALSALLRANALAPLPRRLRTAELRLFQEVKQGDEAALDAQVDQTYRELYPRPFQLPQRLLPPSGHPALLELFTGSDCLPCTAADLAVDSLLQSYRASDLIALEYDEHIPEPDPLATLDTVARADWYGVDATPTLFLDGLPLEVLGSTRSDVENVVVASADQLEQQAMLPSQLHLQLTAKREGPGQVQPGVLLTLAPASTDKGTESTGQISARVLERAVLSIALVQDEMRYGGRNGVRFHRMVVRALHQSPAAGALSGVSAAALPAFNMAAVARQNLAYLSRFESTNDRFGAFEFPEKSFPLDPAHLAVVAWVQDPVTRHVLQSALVLLPAL